MSPSPSRRRDRREPRREAGLSRFLCLSAAAGLFAYCAMSALFGSAGLTAYHALERRKAAMEENLEALASLNERLTGEMESLMSDPDRAAAEARSLGYLRKGETAVLLGKSKGEVAGIETGEVLPFADPPALGDGTIKAISLGIAMALLAALLAPGALGRGARGRYRDRLVQSASLE